MIDINNSPPTPPRAERVRVDVAPLLRNLLFVPFAHVPRLTRMTHLATLKGDRRIEQGSSIFPPGPPLGASRSQGGLMEIQRAANSDQRRTKRVPW